MNEKNARFCHEDIVAKENILLNRFNGTSRTGYVMLNQLIGSETDGADVVFCFLF